MTVLTLRFFASIREQLGVGQLSWPAQPDVATLLDALCAEQGALWGATLGAPQVIVAVNQIVAQRGQALRAGDEVAFFPPVSGG